MESEEERSSLEFTPTWIVAVVCFSIVLISLCVERSLHKLGQLLHRKKQDALYAALEKLKGELMLLGFISLLLTVFQNVISQICIPSHLSYDMLPCKRPGNEITHHGRRLMNDDSSFGHCHTGKMPLLSLEALHHLHIFIFVLAVVHVVFCATTMVLGGAKIRQWKHWEESIKKETNRVSMRSLLCGNHDQTSHAHHMEFLKRAQGFWRKASLISWMIAFFKQFYGSVTKSDYIALRQGFIKKHFPSLPGFDFHKYMVRTLEVDFRRIVGISWYLWFFVVLFLLLNIDGWNTYFWLSFLPLILLLVVGAKLEHIIIRLAEANAVKKSENQEAQVKNKVIEIAGENENLDLKPSDEYFWFGKPGIILVLIHFILFQNSFEIAFFFWIWSTYGFRSCIMEKMGFIITRLFIGIIVQVLCSYSTLPLYALVTQMGNSFKKGMFKNEDAILGWLQNARIKAQAKTDPNIVQIRKIDSELSEIVQVLDRPEIVEIFDQDSLGFSDGEESTVGIDHQANSPPSSSH